MYTLKRFTRAMLQSFTRARLICIMSTVPVMSLFAHSGVAAPVTFAFEAEITEVSPSADVDSTLPPEFDLGQLIDGLVTFEPPFTFGQDTEGASLSLSIDGTIVNGSRLTFDTARVIGGTGNSVSSQESVSIRSENSSTIASTFPHPFSVSQIELLTIRNDFFDPPFNPLVDRIQNVSFWNSFESRRLFIDIRSGSSRVEYRIIALLGPATLVPEPASLATSFAILAIATITHRRRRF